MLPLQASIVICPIGLIGGLAWGTLTVLFGITIAQDILEGSLDESVLQEATESICKGT